MIISDPFSPQAAESDDSCRRCPNDRKVIGRVPRARGGSQKAYGCDHCTRRWIKTSYGWSAISPMEELL